MTVFAYKKLWLVGMLVLLHISYSLYNVCVSKYYKLNIYLEAPRQTLFQPVLPEQLLRTSTLRNISAIMTATNVTDEKLTFNNISYANALKRVASKDKVVVLALIDGGFLDMAINFYITCLRSYNIENYLLIGTDQETCERVGRLRMKCFVYRNDVDAKSPSLYQSKAFLRKMNIRTDMILDAMNLGYAVLHTDIDMYCMKHPLKHIECKKGSCDIATLMDTFAYNAGFIFLQPSAASINVYKRMQTIAKSRPSVDDQKQLNTAMQEEKNKNKKFHIVKLDKKKFLCGKYYYEDAKRYFAEDSAPCPECIVVHNNWIVSMEAKVYRAKEMQQWMYDGGQYYSSINRKYLVYDNPLGGKENDQIRELELKALENAFAIGHILNRTVILPRFHCSEKPCPLNSVVKLVPFDKAYGDCYREHSFLSHPFIPADLLRSRAGPYLIASTFITDHITDENVLKNITAISPKSPDVGMDEREVQFHFGDIPASVLNFYALYSAFDQFVDDEINKKFKKKAKDAMGKGNYRQY